MFISPISEFSFNIKALEQLYLARTNDPDLFVTTSLKKKSNKNKFLSKKVHEIPDKYQTENIKNEI